MTEKRKTRLWDAALDYIIERSRGAPLYDILSGALGMSPEEIEQVTKRHPQQPSEQRGGRETPGERLARDVRECAHFIIRRAGADTQSGEAFVWFSTVVEDGPGCDLAENPIFRQAVRETLALHEGVNRCDMEADGCRISLSPALCPRVNGTHGRRLWDCMGLTWTDAALAHKDQAPSGSPIQLGPDTLTEAGWMHWNDVLSADVCSIQGAGRGPGLILDNVSPDRLRSFVEELAQCQCQQTGNRWFKDPGAVPSMQSPELRI